MLIVPSTALAVAMVGAPSTTSPGCIVSASCFTSSGRAVAGFGGDSRFSSFFFSFRFLRSSFVSVPLGRLPLGLMPLVFGCGFLAGLISPSELLSEVASMSIGPRDALAVTGGLCFRFFDLTADIALLLDSGRFLFLPGELSFTEAGRRNSGAFGVGSGLDSEVESSEAPNGRYRILRPSGCWRGVFL